MSGKTKLLIFSLHTKSCEKQSLKREDENIDAQRKTPKQGNANLDYFLLL